MPPVRNNHLPILIIGGSRTNSEGPASNIYIQKMTGSVQKVKLQSHKDNYKEYLMHHVANNHYEAAWDTVTFLINLL